MSEAEGHLVGWGLVAFFTIVLAQQLVCLGEECGVVCFRHVFDPGGNVGEGVAEVFELMIEIFVVVGELEGAKTRKVKKVLDKPPLLCKGHLVFTFIEHPTFTKQIESLFSDEEYRRLQLDLAAKPESGDVIPGLAGLRKLRWGAKGKGKRGGARIIYLLIPKPGLVYLFYAYTKGDITDMSSEQKKRLAKAVEQIKAEHQK